MTPDQPYNDLPLLPPEKVLETPQILKIAIEAHKELAELKGAGPLIPNQAVLIQTIALQEAKLSSEIESIVTTNDELYRALSDEGERTDPNTKEVLQYNEAPGHGYAGLKSNKRLLNSVLFEELSNIITEKSAGIRKLPGTQLKNPATNQIIYTPPSGENLICDKLGNLERFIYEFQYYIYLNISSRIKALTILDFTESPVKGIGNCGLFIFLRELPLLPKLTLEKILGIRRLINTAIEDARGKLPKIYSRDLVELIFHYPYSKIRFLEEAGIAQRQTASSYLQQIENIGLLKCIKRGKEKYYINQSFLDILTK